MRPTWTSPDAELYVRPVTPFQQNASLLVCRATRAAALVDPGGERVQLEALVEEARADVESILLTHGHLDHAGVAQSLSERLGVPVIGPHEDDRFWLESLPDQGRMFGLADPDLGNCTPERWLAHGELVRVEELELSVLHCPGHTPGHVVFHHEPSALALVGDVLFQGSIGRTDFPRGDHQQLMRAITEVLLPIGDEVEFLPGHGPRSTLGHERRTNPFVLEWVRGAGS